MEYVPLQKWTIGGLIYVRKILHGTIHELYPIPNTLIPKHTIPLSSEKGEPDNKADVSLILKAVDVL